MSTRIDKILKELYKSLTKYNKVIVDKLCKPHKLSSSNEEIISMYAFELLTTAGKLKAPWERFRVILQTQDEEVE
jgi:hypothetical protein